MKILKAFLITTLLGWASIQSTYAQISPDNWNKGISFGIIGTNQITNTGSTHITGDVGAGLFIPIGFDNTTIINGTIYYGGDAQTIPLYPNSIYPGVKMAVSYIYNGLTSHGYSQLYKDLSNKTLGSSETNDLIPGLYSFSSNARITGTLRLNDGGDKFAIYIFMVGTDFNVDAAAKVLMKSGGTAPNVIWIVKGKSIIGSNAALAGNIITNNATDIAITMNSGASISGKLASLNGGISLNTNSINSTLDSDGDGVLDNFDDYPNDATRAYNNMTSPSTIAFEDNWPAKGDYDMNDLVMKYSYNLVTNAQNNVVEVVSCDTLLATGGTKKNAFGIEFPISSSLVTSTSNGTPQLEVGQANAVFMLFSDMRQEMANWNTVSGVPTSNVKMYKVDFSIDSASHITLDNFKVADFNPFILNTDGNLRREIHLPGKQPTSISGTTGFGTVDDSSNKNGRGTYVTSTGLPWAIILPTANFSYPSETKDISLAYPNFDTWAASAGGMFIDWYNNTTDNSYRNYSFIYNSGVL